MGRNGPSPTITRRTSSRRRRSSVNASIMCRTPLRGSNRPTKTIVRFPGAVPSGSACGEKKSVSTPFGTTSQSSPGNDGDSESTTAWETAIRPSRRRRIRLTAGRAACSSRYPSGTTLCIVPTVTGARDHRTAASGRKGPTGLWTCTTSKRSGASRRWSCDPRSRSEERHERLGAVRVERPGARQMLDLERPRRQRLVAGGRRAHRQPRRDQRDVVAAARELRRLAVDVLGDPAELRVVVVADDRDSHARHPTLPGGRLARFSDRQASGTRTAKLVPPAASASKTSPPAVRARRRASGSPSPAPRPDRPAAPARARLEDRVPLVVGDARSVVSHRYDAAAPFRASPTSTTPVP